jgi:hypothetical protein
MSFDMDELEFYQTYCQDRPWHVVDPDTGSMICGGPLETVFLPGVGDVIRAKPPLDPKLEWKLRREILEWKLRREIARAGPDNPPNIGKVILDYERRHGSDGANTNDAVTATLAVLSPTLAKMVRFLAEQPGRKAHIRDISSKLDKLISPGLIAMRTRTVRRRFERARDILDENVSPLMLSVDKSVISLMPRKS